MEHLTKGEEQLIELGWINENNEFTKWLDNGGYYTLEFDIDNESLSLFSKQHNAVWGTFELTFEELKAISQIIEDYEWER